MLDPMKIAVAFAKIATLAVWFWGLLSFVMPAQVPAPSIGRMVVLGLLAVHIAESIGFAKPLAEDTGDSLASHRWQLLLFGYVHVLNVRYSRTPSS